MTSIKSAFQPLHKAIAEQRQRILEGAKQFGDIKPRPLSEAANATVKERRCE